MPTFEGQLPEWALKLARETWDRATGIDLGDDATLEEESAEMDRVLAVEFEKVRSAASRHPAASEERGFREWWLREGYHHMPGAGEPPEHAAVAELAWNAALQSMPSSPPHQIADVTVDAPKGIPGWIKVEPNSPPPRTCQEEQD